MACAGLTATKCSPAAKGECNAQYSAGLGKCIIQRTWPVQQHQVSLMDCPCPLYYAWQAILYILFWLYFSGLRPDP